MENLNADQYLHTISDGAFAAVLVVVSVLGIYSLALHVFLAYYRHHPLIQSASPLFGQLIVLGSWFVYAAVIVMRYKAESGACSIIPVFLCTAFVLMIGTLFAKTWRLKRIVHDSNLLSVRVTSVDVAKFIGAFFAFDLVINVIWEAVDTPVARLEADALDSNALNPYCHSEYFTAWYVLLIVPKGLLLLWGLYLAYHIRHISASFNESRFIGLTILHGVIFALIAIPLDLGLHNQLTAHYLVVTLLLCLCTFVTLTLLFAPKVYAILIKKKRKRELERPNSSNQHADLGNGANQHTARWPVYVDSESKQFSFPSQVGFKDAVKLVRLIAESLYKDQGAHEYYRFCLAMRAMAQREIEAQAPLMAQLVKDDHSGDEKKVSLPATTFTNNNHGSNGSSGALPVSNMDSVDSACAPLSQAPSVLNNSEIGIGIGIGVDIDLDSHHSSLPITQATFARANSSLVAMVNDIPMIVELVPVTVPSRPEFESMPELPEDAWQLLSGDTESFAPPPRFETPSTDTDHSYGQSGLSQPLSQQLSMMSVDAVANSSHQSSGPVSQSKHYLSQASSTLTAPHLQPAASPASASLTSSMVASPASTMSLASMPSESQSQVGHISHSPNDSDQERVRREGPKHHYSGTNTRGHSPNNSRATTVSRRAG